MAKTAKTREELIAEANAPKTEQPAEQVDDSDTELTAEQASAIASIDAVEEAAELFDADMAAPADPRKDQRERHEAAVEKLRLIATSYPNTTPNEHTIFGFGGHRYSLGDLRDLFALPRR